jgi:hypothetical protein
MQQETQRGPIATTANQEARDSSNGADGDQHQIDDRYNFHDASFRRHYQLNYHDNPHDYEYYAPAYRFGYELAEENAGMDWGRIETEAQEHWQTQHNIPWQEMAEAIHYGWLEQRDPDALRVHHHGEYDDYRNSFQSHYAEEMAAEGAPFEHLEPAYRYGYDMAIDPAYNTHLWAEVEPEVREYYETEYADGQAMAWERYRNAAAHAWHSVRSTGQG